MSEQKTRSPGFQNEMGSTTEWGERTWFNVYTDDGGEARLLLDRGNKADVFRVMEAFPPSTMRVIEVNRDAEFAETIEALNGEEWLRSAICPLCHRMDSDTIMDKSLASPMNRFILKARILKAEGTQS